jgi:hypothetical protein
MPQRRRLVVVGIVGAFPFSGMAWMHGQYLAGLAQLGHDVYYIETTDTWPYDPLQQTKSAEFSYALRYLQNVMSRFGMGERWAYRAACAGGAWHGPAGSRALELLASADAVFNISASTTPEEVGVPCRLVHIGTDPVLQELRIANGDVKLRERLAAHAAHFTYGENIGAPDCPVPPLPFPTKAMRQPIVLDYWRAAQPSRDAFTTVTNWEVTGYDCEYNGELYTWSKHHAYMKILDLPRRTHAALELAMGLSGVTPQIQAMLRGHGWNVVDASAMSLDPWLYRDYICTSGAELSVAKDMVTRTRSGWFSERSACYLAAGKPVITQDTGFGCALPTGEGLFAFGSGEEALGAIDAVRADYARHCRAARRLAEDYFDARKVLGGVLDTLGL